MKHINPLHCENILQTNITTQISIFKVKSRGVGISENLQGEAGIQGETGVVFSNSAKILRRGQLTPPLPGSFSDGPDEVKTD